MANPFTSFISKPGTALYTNSIVAAGGFNFLPQTTGAANALIGTLLAAGATTNIAVGFGLGVRIKTAFALQAGTNTLKLNGVTFNIKTQRSGGAGNLNTPIAAGAILDLVVDSGTATIQLMGY